MHERLARVPLFAALEPDDLDHVERLSRVLQVRKKTVIFSEGQPYLGMYVVLRGLAVVYTTSDEGRMLILDVCRPGDTFAEIPLFEAADAGHRANARTTRDSEILFLPKDRFEQFAKTRPLVVWRLAQILAAKFKDVSVRLEGVTLREVRSRLARYLLREIDASGSNELTLPLTKGSTASYLGTVHETLSRTMSRLARDKVIDVDGRRITVLDRKGLERML